MGVPIAGRGVWGVAVHAGIEPDHVFSVTKSGDDRLSGDPAVDRNSGYVPHTLDTMNGLQTFLWSREVLLPIGGQITRSVALTDSWLLEDGAALALDVHRERFLASVETIAPERVDEADGFWNAAMLELPTEGTWFPKLELAVPSEGAEAVFRLAVRPSPPRSASIALVTASHDPRLVPGIKGPDLARLETLRTEAKAGGSDEAVILSPDGLVVEGNYTSLVWWRGDALCVVADGLPRLPGVTERALVTLATVLGVEILHDEVTPDDLDGLELWALNSLHGARIATRWEGGPALAEEPGRLRLWRTRLDALRRPVR
jgi:branched-subunit amino acid aminotransferase/4-amino-4-deoxychorismate lyase